MASKQKAASWPVSSKSSKEAKDKGGKNADGKDADWVVESVVQFLRSPVWNVPVLTFIEEHSIIFDQGTSDHDEYKKKHEKYKSLIGALIASYIEDMGMSQKQFIEACDKDSSKPGTQYHQGLFEQIWAADDYEIFKRMMTQKNIELEIQALHMIKQRNGVLPDSMQPDASGDQAPFNFLPLGQEEELMMQEILRRSKTEYEEQQKTIDANVNHDIEMAIAQSQNVGKMLHAERNMEVELLDKAVKMSISDTSIAPKRPGSASKQRTPAASSKAPESPAEKPDSKLQPTKKAVKPSEQTSPRSSQEAAAQWVEQAREEAAECVAQTRAAYMAEISSPELKVRTEYLKGQRDKLIAMKKQERNKKLAQYEQERPKSAVAAHQVMSESDSKIDKKTLEMRKALAEKLKKEVVFGSP